MAEQGIRWLGVLDGDDFVGWIDGDDLDGVATLADLSPRRTHSVVSPDSTLRQALEVILNSRSEVAIVLEDDHRYLGAVTLESIRRELG